MPYGVGLGGTAYMNTTSIPTGLSDGKTMTMSFWGRVTSDSGTTIVYQFFASSASRVRIRRGSGNKLTVFGNGILDIASNTSLNVALGLFHAYVCVDMDSKANTKIYINGVSDGWTETTFSVGSTLDHTGASGTWSIGANSTGTEIHPGDMTEFWFNDQYLDNPLLFRSARGRPMDLGTTGQNPTGSAPVFYYSRNGGGTSWNVNGGTGGNMTFTGTPTNVQLFR